MYVCGYFFSRSAVSPPPVFWTTPLCGRESPIHTISSFADTHSQISERVQVPPGDVLLHAGDFSNVGLPKDIQKFADYLSTLPHPHKVYTSLETNKVPADLLCVLESSFSVPLNIVKGGMAQ